MRADGRSRRPRPSGTPAFLLVGLVVGATLLVWLASGPAWSADPRLDRARAGREAAQAKLDDLLQRVSALEAEVSAAQARLDQLTRAENDHRQAASNALLALSTQMVIAYKHGSTDPTLVLLSSRSPLEAAQRLEILTMLAKRNRAELEGASSARIRTHADAVLTEQTARELRARQAELSQLRARVEAEVARAQQIEDQVKAQVAEAGRVAGAPAPVIGSIACPVGTPRHYSDTYGAPRSGGRRHKGVDILAARGTPIYAYESGTITQLSSNPLGGISLYLTGSSGTRYYYTHLRGYVSGVHRGMQVSAGQHIAFSGDTGNARGIPHLHWEVRPGGGANVNPYPYARRACG